eukprot:20984-Heterococcus_DN1.PRE.1
MDFGIDQSGVQQLIGGTDQELAHSIFSAMTQGQAKVVNVLCLMAGIVIICNSDSKTTLSADTLIAAKAKLLFDVFDFNQKGYISRDETSILLLSVSQIMRIITVQTSTAAAAVDAAGMDAMAHDLFTQGAFDNDEITCEQFVSTAVQCMTHADEKNHSIVLDKLGLISNTTAAASDSHEYATAHSEPQVTTASGMVTPADMNSVTVATADVVSPTADFSSVDTAECGAIAMTTDTDVQAQSIIADTSSENTNLNTLNKDLAAAVTANENDADAAATVNVISDVIAPLQEVTSVSAHVNVDKLLASPVSDHYDLAINEPLHTGATTTVTADSTSNGGAVFDTNAIKEQHSVTKSVTPATSTTSVVTATTATAAAAVEPVLSEKHSDVATIAHDDLHVSKSAKNTPVLQRADSELQQKASGVILLADKSAYSAQHKPQLLLLTAAADTVIDHTTTAIATATATATTAPPEHVSRTANDDTPPVTIANDDSQTAVSNTSGVKHAVEKITPNDDTYTCKSVVPVDAVKATVALTKTATVADSVLANSDNDSSTSHDDGSTIQPVITVCNEQSDDVTPVLTAAATATVGTSAAQTRLLQRAESELQQEATGVILLSDKAA